MRNLTTAIWLCIGAMASIESANAQSATTSVRPCTACRAAPAPSIGTGVPAVLVIGGVLIGANLLMRRRRPGTTAD